MCCNTLQRFALSQDPDKFLKVPLCGTFKNLSVPFKASTGCILTLNSSKVGYSDNKDNLFESYSALRSNPNQKIF
jgi:hypothetical protein